MLTMSWSLWIHWTWGWFPMCWPFLALLLILESFVAFFWLWTTYFASHFKWIGVQIFIISSMPNFDLFLFYWGHLYIFMCQYQWDSSRAQCYVCSSILQVRHYSIASVSHGLGATLWLGLICMQCIYCCRSRGGRTLSGWRVLCGLAVLFAFVLTGFALARV